MPGGARTIGTVHAAEPMEIEWIEARAWRAEQGCERYARMDQRNRRAVLRCLRKQIILKAAFHAGWNTYKPLI